MYPTSIAKRIRIVSVIPRETVARRILRSSGGSRHALESAVEEGQREAMNTATNATAPRRAVAEIPDRVTRIPR